MKVGLRNDGDDGNKADFYLEYSNGRVYLKAVDYLGESWCVAIIDESGISICGDVCESTGWPLDKHGRMKVSFSTCETE